MTQIVLATRNQGKVRELQAMLQGKAIEVVGLDQFPQIGEIEETGETFEENAHIKAQAVSQATGLIALADDSGLVVDALNGEPGVHSARYSGEAATDAANNEKLMAAMQGVPQDKRGCKFVSAVVAHSPDGHELVFQGVWLGRLAEEPKGEGGFGYDPLFYDQELKLTAAEMTPEQKNERSHRGRAMRELMKYFPEFVDLVARDAGLTPEEREFKYKYDGVRGWLKFLSMVMMVGVPLVSAWLVSVNLQFVKVLEAPGGPPPELAAEVAKALTLQNVMAAVVGFLAFWAGLSLYRRKRGAVLFAKIAWLAVPLAGGINYLAAQYFLAYPPDVREMATAAALATSLPGLFAATASVYYLSISKRVRATFSQATK